MTELFSVISKTFQSMTETKPTQCRLAVLDTNRKLEFVFCGSLGTFLLFYVTYQT